MTLNAWDASKPLPDERHELFAQELAKGAKGVAAAIAAGFKDGPGIRQAAHRLLTNSDIRSRRDWLMENAARKTTITLAEGTEALLRIAGKAERLEHAPGLAVARASIMSAMEAHGLIVHKSEHVGNEPALTPAERRQLIDILRSQIASEAASEAAEGSRARGDDGPAEPVHPVH